MGNRAKAATAKMAERVGGARCGWCGRLWKEHKTSEVDVCLHGMRRMAEDPGPQPEDGPTSALPVIQDRFAEMVAEYRSRARIIPEERRADWACLRLDELRFAGDHEGSHERADALLCSLLPPDVGEAFARLTRWYA